MTNRADRPDAVRCRPGPDPRRATGNAGEDHAVEWLERHGFSIIDRNWRCARGEVDIVAREDDTIVFIEVKTRTGQSAGHPFEAVTPLKLARIRQLVPAWFHAHRDQTARAIRIDCIAVTMVEDHVAVEHVEALG
ncbi:YraN family protein [Curtobacterium sp. MCPF17_047]|uniref:YraN family protein n=1 Tax=unclassified Curtobacterium TaxID=257496 RepID=UPI000DAA87AF|nr:MULTISPECIES: YraN family protein [unclassified Curtobacterium]PZE55510.1 YraN family protein [Curtobacterium sp. MCPF17_001]PZF62937.1 YraN family protein [Curtobacterium sp. MCPF17_047]